MLIIVEIIVFHQTSVLLVDSLSSILECAMILVLFILCLNSAVAQLGDAK